MELHSADHLKRIADELQETNRLLRALVEQMLAMTGNLSPEDMAALNQVSAQTEAVLQQAQALESQTQLPK